MAWGGSSPGAEGTTARERFGPVPQREAVVADEPFLVLGRAEQATTLIRLEERAPAHPAPPLRVTLPSGKRPLSWRSPGATHKLGRSARLLNQNT